MSDIRGSETITIASGVAAVPPIAITGFNYFVGSLPNLVLFVTLVYTLVALIIMIRNQIYEPWIARKRCAKGLSCNTCKKRLMPVGAIDPADPIDLV